MEVLPSVVDPEPAVRGLRSGALEVSLNVHKQLLPVSKNAAELAKR